VELEAGNHFHCTKISTQTPAASTLWSEDGCSIFLETLVNFYQNIGHHVSEKNKLFSAVIIWTRLKVSYIWSSVLRFLNYSASGYCGSQGKSTDTFISFIGEYLISKSINVRRHGGRI